MLTIDAIYEPPTFLAEYLISALVTPSPRNRFILSQFFGFNINKGLFLAILIIFLLRACRLYRYSAIYQQFQTKRYLIISSKTEYGVTFASGTIFPPSTVYLQFNARTQVLLDFSSGRTWHRVYR